MGMPFGNNHHHDHHHDHHDHNDGYGLAMIIANASMTWCAQRLLTPAPPISKLGCMTPQSLPPNLEMGGAGMRKQRALNPRLF